MKRLVLLFSLIISFSYTLMAHPWMHLELGAGNYGQDGHTKTALRKTILSKLKKVSAEKNFVDDLEECGNGNYDPFEQYAVLFWTLDELVKRYGPEGVFYVNDLCEEYTLFAVAQLTAYARQKEYHTVVIEPAPGDYERIDFTRYLLPYGEEKYTSIHLKNPEISFYYDTMDGDLFLTSESSCEKTRALLQSLANLGKEGLYLFIIDHENFIPPEEKKDWMQESFFYQPSLSWEPVPYVFPEGEVIERTNGKVFLIPCHLPMKCANPMNSNQL